MEVGWLTTRLLSQDGVELVVPNSQLAAHGFAAAEIEALLAHGTVANAA